VSKKIHSFRRYKCRKLKSKAVLDRQKSDRGSTENMAHVKNISWLISVVF